MLEVFVTQVLDKLYCQSIIKHSISTYKASRNFPGNSAPEVHFTAV